MSFCKFGCLDDEKKMVGMTQINSFDNLGQFGSDALRPLQTPGIFFTPRQRDHSHKNIGNDGSSKSKIVRQLGAPSPTIHGGANMDCG